MNYTRDQQLILLQQLRERQDNEITNMQDYENKMQEIRKTNDLKFKQRQEYNEMLEREKLLQQLYNKKSSDQEKFLMEKSLQRKQQIETHINMNKQLNIYVFKQSPVNTQVEYEKKLQNDQKQLEDLNQLTKKANVELARKKVEENNELLRQELERKKLEKEIQDKLKQEYIDEQKQQNQFDQEQKKLQFEQKMEEAKAKNEQQKKQIRHEYDLKLKKVEERRLAQEEEQKEKEEQNKKKNEEQLQKMQEIMNKALQQEEEQKQFYLEKQKQAEQRKQKLEVDKSLDYTQIQKEKQEKQKKRTKMKKENENLYRSKIKEAEKKQSEKDEILERIKFERKLMANHYINTKYMMQIDRIENVKRQELQDEYKREILKQNIEDKMRKSDQIIIEKRKIAKKKQYLKCEIDLQKDNINLELTKLKQGKLDPEIVYKKILGEEAKEKIDKIKKKFEVKEPKIQQKQSINQQNIINKQELLEKQKINQSIIQDVQIKQNQEMIILLQQQKDDEQEQSKILKRLKNQNEIDKYNKIFETEKRQMEFKIKQLQEIHQNQLQKLNFQGTQ